MQTLFAIGIPTINRADLLNESLQKYICDFPNTHIYVCDNGRQNLFKHSNIEISVQHENLGVAKSWNYLLRQIYATAGNAIIMNDDIYWGKNEEEVTKYITENSNEDFIVATGNWCNFVLPEKTFQEVGPFDEDFKTAYYEDNDYHYRMKLLNKSYLATPFMAPGIYRNSMSIAKDLTLNANFGHNKERYVMKWGGLPAEEIFQFPFNKQ